MPGVHFSQKFHQFFLIPYLLHGHTRHVIHVYNPRMCNTGNQIENDFPTMRYTWILILFSLFAAVATRKNNGTRQGMVIYGELQKVDYELMMNNLLQKFVGLTFGSLKDCQNYKPSASRRTKRDLADL